MLSGVRSKRDDAAPSSAVDSTSARRKSAGVVADPGVAATAAPARSALAVRVEELRERCALLALREGVGLLLPCVLRGHVRQRALSAARTPARYNSALFSCIIILRRLWSAASSLCCVTSGPSLCDTCGMDSAVAVADANGDEEDAAMELPTSKHDPPTHNRRIF